MAQAWGARVWRRVGTGAAPFQSTSAIPIHTGARRTSDTKRAPFPIRRKSAFASAATTLISSVRVTAADRKRRRRNFLPHLKIFLQKRLPQKGYPLSGANRFWAGFWERGHEQFSESKSPPYRGVASAARTLLSIRGGGGSARPPGSAPARALVLRATPGATAPKTNNPQMGVACCFGVCVSSSAASALKCTPRSVDEGRQGRRRTRCSANKDPPRMRNPERVKWSTCGEMICHALSVRIRCATHLEVRSPHFVVAETHCT